MNPYSLILAVVIIITTTAFLVILNQNINDAYTEADMLSKKFESQLTSNMSAAGMYILATKTCEEFINTPSKVWLMDRSIVKCRSYLLGR